MNEREICLALLAAKTETDVVNVLTQEGLWGVEAWSLFGDKENNFSTIGNQQAHPEAALVEKLVNSIDAVLTQECWRQGIDPESSDAPPTIKAAVARFFGVRDGNLSELTGTELTKLAGHIGIAATGTKSNPNIIVFDRGEGQEPDSFPRTFMSLGDSNKLRIPFVQGKFNMGGTGVLQFCGRHNLQLVVSRRNPDLAPADQSWGFSIVRRDDPTGNVRNSVYRYLAPAGRVLRFEDKTGRMLDALDAPGAVNAGELPVLEWGTIIKLFDYQLPGGTKTNILWDLFNDISCLLPGVALPIRFFERRDYTGHTLESTMIGLEARLDRDTRDNLEFDPTAHVLETSAARLPARLYCFKEREDGKSSSEKFRGREGVIFLMNGQAQGYLDKAFFRRSKLNLSYIADDLLILVDATQLHGRPQEDLFMNSRDRLREGNLKRELEMELEDLLKHHDLLRELGQKRREQRQGKRLEDDKALQDVLQDVINRSHALRSLLITGEKIADPASSRPASTSRLAFQGKRFPTFFTLQRGNAHRPAHKGQRFKVQFETDAENLYFVRDQEPGLAQLTLDAEEQTDFVINLLNGVGTVNISLPPKAAIGARLTYVLEISDAARADPFEIVFERTVAAPVEQGQTSRGHRQPPAEEGPGERRSPDRLALPQITSVRKPDWGPHRFTAESALRVDRSPDGSYDFYVNIDNRYLAAEVRSWPGKRSIIEAQFKYSVALVGLASLRWSIESEDDNADNEADAAVWAQAMAPFLVPMIQGLAELDEDAPD